MIKNKNRFIIIHTSPVTTSRTVVRITNDIRIHFGVGTFHV